ncbi:MAG: hypothetical protein QOK42_874 [Frankiaceae bacterium]|nr:hypothetical protein [Frankiaceae bacterium]MDX6226172.1 hypothetical protein [Frankiales bacterium]
MWRPGRTAFVCALAVLASLVASSSAAATSTTGHDVSSPQCGSPLPTTGTFGIVGLTDGLPFAEREAVCLGDQWAWATALSGPPALYMNTANPNGTSTHYTYPAGNHPALCGSDTTLAGCAYDYGWHTATDALAKAEAAGITERLSVTWWLDVETANSWGGTVQQNAADLQGAVDALRSSGVPQVGLYSSAGAWQTITGSYRRSTAASYRSAWAPYFTPRYPLEDAPVWVAGAGTVSDASARCATSFTQGQTLLAQYLDGSVDGDLQCAPADTVAPSASLTAPTKLYSLGTSVTAAWTGADSGTGVVSYDVRYRRALSNGSFGSDVYLPSWQRTTARSATLTGNPTGSTVCFQARSRDVAGNTSPWSASRCSAVALDDRSLSRSGAWTSVSSSPAYLGTISRSATAGAQLIRTGLVTHRLMLVATKCHGCGSVEVWVNTSRLAIVSLEASATTYRAVIALPTFSLRTAKVSIRARGTGPVLIDGLVTSQV